MDERGPCRMEIAEHAIPLGAFLKYCAAVETGGEAKHLIQLGGVTVNGVVEIRRRHLLVNGDCVCLPDGRRYLVVSHR